jgi:hypothetical protein
VMASDAMNGGLDLVEAIRSCETVASHNGHEYGSSNIQFSDPLNSNDW